MCTVLEILQKSENGLTQSQFAQRVKEEGIKNAFPDLGTLITQGLVRFDESPRPGRFKATSKAWSQDPAA